jgi:2,3-dihydroxybenzoate decarboxylase
MRIQKIAVEEHFGEPGTVDESQQKFFPPDRWPKLRSALVDIHGQLLANMDAYGVQMSLLSLTSPGIQEIPDRQQAIDTARRSNDYLAEQVAKRPDRFQALAALPMQDPDAATRELVRCVKELGFRGACVNGFSEVGQAETSVYCDLPQYWPFWETVQNLDLPFYLHPRRPLKNRPDLEGHPWLLAGAWAFGVETATHALRLITSGLFDKYPKVAIVLGHLGETLPNAIWRIENRLRVMPRGLPAKKPIGEYLRNNFYFTTSGNCCTKTLVNTIFAVGADRIMFATDSPFEQMSEAAQWFDQLDAISETDRLKIARTNAEKVFKLGRPQEAAVSA